MKINTRFAPSPTGFLHVGGLRTALYAYCLAKKSGGKFILRIEDTDQNRFVEGAIESLIKSLNWAGIFPDEGVSLDEKENIIEIGKNGPYIQSKRLEIYKKYVEQLIEQGNAYYCFCTSERLNNLRKEQELNKIPTGYDRHCRNLDINEAKQRILNGEKYVVRMKMPETGETSFDDLIRGKVVFSNKQIEDQILLKSDGFPTYHLAVVIDDHFMDINLIIRGEEWISSTPKHLKLYEYFGWNPPQIAHLTLILNKDKTKLSKRQGDVAVEDYVKKGYLSEALINFIAFLGWNPGDEREFFSLEQLIKEFSLEKVNKSSAIFNIDKLNWFNKEYIKKISDTNFIQLAKPYLLENKIVKEFIKNNKNSNTFIEKAIILEKSRLNIISEITESVSFLFDLPKYNYDLLVWKKSTKEEVKKILSEISIVLNEIIEDDWNNEFLTKKIGEWIEYKNYSNGIVLWPLRVALSGKEKSPGPFEISDILGKKEVLNRVNKAIKNI